MLRLPNLRFDLVVVVTNRNNSRFEHYKTSLDSSSTSIVWNIANMLVNHRTSNGWSICSIYATNFRFTEDNKIYVYQSPNFTEKEIFKNTDEYGDADAW